jgi:hypothetical protein
MLALYASVALLAGLNFRAGRGDIRGAGRLAAFVFGAEILEWLCTAHHVSAVAELGLFVRGMGWATLVAGSLWMLYLALEPYVRRLWPHSPITWNRLLGGGFGDPLVGGHLLVGVGVGIAISVCSGLKELALEHSAGFRASTSTLEVLLGAVLDTRRMAGQMVSVLVTGIGIGLGLVFLFFLLRVLLRRQWLAGVVFVLLFNVPDVLGSGHPVIEGLEGLIEGLIMLACMHWFGVLPLIVANVLSTSTERFPLTTDLSAWYAGSAVAVVVVALTLTAYAFHTALAGRPLFKAGFLEPN